MPEEWSTSDKATIRAGWIGAGGAVAAAIVAAVVAVLVAHSSSGSSQPKTLRSPDASSRATTSPSSIPRKAGSPARTWTETAFTQSKTFANFVSAGDPQGAKLRPGQAVKVSCRVRGFKVNDGDPWWYRLTSPPWNGHFYATSDVFYNTRNTSGNPINGVTVDKKVPIC